MYKEINNALLSVTSHPPSHGGCRSTYGIVYAGHTRMVHRTYFILLKRAPFLSTHGTNYIYYVRTTTYKAFRGMLLQPVYMHALRYSMRVYVYNGDTYN